MITRNDNLNLDLFDFKAHEWTTEENLLNKMKKAKRRKKLWKLRLGNLPSEKERSFLLVLENARQSFSLCTAAHPEAAEGRTPIPACGDSKCAAQHSYLRHWTQRKSLNVCVNRWTWKNCISFHTCTFPINRMEKNLQHMVISRVTRNEAWRIVAGFYKDHVYSNNLCKNIYFWKVFYLSMHRR